MAHSDIEKDLHTMLDQIACIVSGRPEASSPVFAKTAGLLTGFVARHRPELSFENFPLPPGKDEVLCSYELGDEALDGPALIINAVRGGVNSVVHDHGTWAVVVGIEGDERHRIYRRVDDGLRAGRATLSFEHETTVCDGRSLIIEDGLFHSIHTGINAPALVLHLYGRPLDMISGRQIVDLSTGRLARLSGPSH
jgi:hypothetical protein